MDYPRISIVTPVFNQVKYLEETILSILNQHYPNLEYIIIDGGSTDGTVDIIKKYESKLAYWVSEPDKGMYDALQKGFDHSSGEIMGWLNADDLYFKGCLNLVAKLFSAHYEINWVTGTTHIINSEGTFISNKPAKQFHKYQYLTGDYQWISQESALWRRSLWDRCGSMFNTHLRYAGDFELWLRFIQETPLYCVEFPIGIFRKRENQLSVQGDAYYKEVRQIYESLFISDEDTKIIREYRERKRWAKRINRMRFLNGNVIAGLTTFENAHFKVPDRIAYSTENDSFFTGD
jgi:glycosyltransferase involved in cell wall biosynthesis